MHAVETNGEYTQNYPTYSSEPLFQKTINARDLWDKIVYNAFIENKMHYEEAKNAAIRRV